MSVLLSLLLSSLLFILPFFSLSCIVSQSINQFSIVCSCLQSVWHQQSVSFLSSDLLICQHSLLDCQHWLSLMQAVAVFFISTTLDQSHHHKISHLCCIHSQFSLSSLIWYLNSADSDHQSHRSHKSLLSFLSQTDYSCHLTEAPVSLCWDKDKFSLTLSSHSWVDCSQLRSKWHSLWRS